MKKLILGACIALLTATVVQAQEKEQKLPIYANVAIGVIGK